MPNKHVRRGRGGLRRRDEPHDYGLKKLASELKRAERELAANKERIEGTVRGTPGGRSTSKRSGE